MQSFYIILFIIILAVAGFIFLPTLYYKYINKQTFQPLDENVEKAVMLTFDDGPDAIHTQRLLALLAKYQIKATFFLIAEKATRHPEVVNDILQGGHAIGFHGTHHENMGYQGFLATKKNFQEGLSLLESSLPADASPTIHYYRPPHGFLNPFTMYFAKKHRLKPIFWNVIVQDWSQRSSSRSILRALFKLVNNGSIILLHDSSEGTEAKSQTPEKMLEALAAFLPEMKEQGYTFLLPAQCLIVHRKDFQEKRVKANELTCR